MKTAPTSAVSRLSSSLRLTAAAIACLAISPAHANINFKLNLWHAYGNFYGSATLTSTNPIATYHRVESPNGAIFKNVGSSYDGSFTNLGFSGLIDECTNGLWTLIQNVDDPTAQTNTFSVSLSGITSNMFGDASILSPMWNEVVSANPPVIEWTGPANFPSLTISVDEYDYPYTPVGFASLPSTTTNWSPSAPLSGGHYDIFLSYSTNHFAGASFSPPPVPDWSASASLTSYDNSAFYVAGGGDPLDTAVESPGLSWSTGGDYGGSGWFVQTYETFVGPSALQSDAPDYATSWIETTVQGPGTLSFDFAFFGDYNDGIDFEAVDQDDNSYYGFGYYGYDFFYGWDSDSIDLEPGTNTLRWTFYNNDDTAGDYDAAFLDNVVYTYTGSNSVSYEAELEINIQRTTQGGTTKYLMFPSLSNLSPEPITTHRVESPTGKSSGEEFTASSSQYSNLQAVVTEILAGDWKLDFNYGHGSEYQYTFTVTTNNLWINDLPQTLLIEPLDAATGVATNTDYAWIGPVGFDSLTISVRNEEGGGSLGFSSLSPIAMSWTNGPALPEGTNSVSVYYTSNNFSGLTVSWPVDTSFNPISNWNSSTRLTTQAHSKFVVGGGFVPLPVTFLPPMMIGGGFGLSFISQSGATHWVEYTTNLVTGPWMPVTNFPGDGTTHQLLLPATNAASYFHVETQ